MMNDRNDILSIVAFYLPAYNILDCQTIRMEKICF